MTSIKPPLILISLIVFCVFMTGCGMGGNVLGERKSAIKTKKYSTIVYLGEETTTDAHFGPRDISFDIQVLPK